MRVWFSLAWVEVIVAVGTPLLVPRHRPTRTIDKASSFLKTRDLIFKEQRVHSTFIIYNLRGGSVPVTSC
eukprot:scaffold7117_cov199-Alexandrium_tamarense.AAC.10